MPKVIIRKYSTFFDPGRNIQFSPVLDRSAGVYIGVADVSQTDAEYFSKNGAYEVLTDSQYYALVTGHTVEASSEWASKIRSDAELLNRDLAAAPVKTAS